ncbi:MAG: PAS domain-containing protein, partial [Anaerolineae bacterium]
MRSLLPSREVGEDLLSQLVSTSPAAVIVFTQDGSLVQANEAFLNLAGCAGGQDDVPEALGDLIAPQAHDLWSAAVESAIGKSRAHFVGHLQRRNGDTVTVRATIHSTDAAADALLYAYVELVAGVTDPESVEERHLRRLHTLVRASRQVLAETEIEGLLQRVIDAARDLTGARAGMASYGYRDGCFRVAAASRAGEVPAAPTGPRFTVSESGAYMRLVRDGVPVRLTQEELVGQPGRWELPEGHTPLRGLLGAPLYGSDGGPSGLIVLSDRESGDFSAEDEPLLLQLAHVASLGLRHVEAHTDLRQRLAEMDAVYEVLPQPVVVFDANGRALRANPAARDLFGFVSGATVEEALATGVSLFDVDGSPADAEALPHRRALRGEAVTDRPYRVVRADGEERMVLLSAVPLRGSDGIRGAVASGHDVTEQMRSERAREDATRFPEENPNAVLRIDAGGVVQFANRASEPLLERWRVDRGQAAPGEVQQLAVSVLASGNTAMAEVPVRDGTLELQFVPFSQAGYVNVYGRDVTARVRAAEQAATLAAELARERDLLAAVMEGTDAQLAYLDTDFRYVMANSAYVTGIGIDDLIGRCHLDLVTDPRERRVFEQVRDSGEPVAYAAVKLDYRRYAGQGATYWDWTLAPVKSGSGQVRGLVLALIDVTESVSAKLRTEELAQEAQRHASVLEATISSIADGVIIRDSAGHIVRQNETARRIFFPDVKPGELPPANWARMAVLEHPDGSPYAPMDVPGMRALGGQTTTSEVARLRQPGAALVWLAVGGAPIVDAAGRQLGAISIYPD